MPLSEVQSMAWRNPAISVTTFLKQTFHPTMLCPFYKQKCADSIVCTLSCATSESRTRKLNGSTRNSSWP